MATTATTAATAATAATGAKLELVFAYQGVSERASVSVDGGTDALYGAARSVFGLGGEEMRLVFRGQRVVPGTALTTSLIESGPTDKILVM